MIYASTLQQKTPQDIRFILKDRLRQRRKQQKLSQAGLSEKADVSLGSLKRFETTGEISLTALIKIAIALDCEDDFDLLFSRKHYQSIEEVIADATRT